jgi:hypothetical protein
MLWNAELWIFREVRPSLFLWKKERTILDQELSRPHAVLLDEQFFLKHVPLFRVPSHGDGEADETVNALLTPKVVWKLLEGSTTLIQIRSRKFL